MTAVLTPSWGTPTARVVIPAEQLVDRGRWLTARTKGVTSTNTRVLSGHGYANETVTGIWLEKVEPEDTPVADEDTPLAWEIGSEIEPIIAKLASRDLGVEMRRVGMLQHKDIPHLLDSCDRNTSDGGGAELKSTEAFSLKRHQDRDSEWTNRDGWTLPAGWWAQSQHHLLVSGWSHIHVCALLLDRRRMTYWTVERDSAQLEKVAERAAAFWGYVETRVMPPLDFMAVTEAEIKARHPKATASSVIVANAAEVRRLIRDRATFKSSDKDHADLLTDIENRLKVIAGDAADVLDQDGNRLFSFANRSRKAIDLKRLAEDHPDINLADYETSNGFRQLGSFAKAV